MAEPVKFSWRRVALLGGAAIAGALGGVYGQPWIHDNPRAVEVIVTAFSILAGFLIAIMTIIGDPSGFGRRSWRGHELSRGIVYRRLRRQEWLFYLYLSTLGLIFIESLISRKFPSATPWLEGTYLGLAIAAFVLSFRLPAVLMRIQLDRHDECIDAKRKPITDQAG